MIDQCLLCIGGLLIVGGGFWWFNTLMFLRRAEQAQGMIVDENVHHSKGGSFHAPVVEFQTARGEKIRFTEKLGSGAGRGEGLGGILMLFQYLFALREGKNHDDVVNEMDTVQVVYDPEKPGHAHIKSFQYLHFIPLLLIAVGIGISLSAIPFFSGHIGSFRDFIDTITKRLPF